MFFRQRKRRRIYKKFTGSLLQALFFIVIINFVSADEPEEEKCSIEDRPELKDVYINELLPDPSDSELSEKKEKEKIELFNSGENKVDLSSCYLADGKYDPDELNLEKAFKIEEEEIDEKEYLVFKRANFGFDMNKSKEYVYFLDEEGEVLDQVYYKSSEKDFSYALNEKGEWQWTGLVTFGEENQFIKYSEKLEITEFLPNPDGSDGGKEWIEILSDDEEEVDLEGWSFQCGSSKLKLESTKIEPEERLLIKIDKSSSFIKNSDSSVVFLNPNGEVVDEIEYEDSAKEDCSYSKKDNGRWEWTIFITPGKENKFNHPPTFKVDIPDKIYEEIKTEFKLEKVEDKDGEELKYKWDFGDGHASYLKETTHKYEDEGIYTVQVRVSDASVDVIKRYKIEVKDFPEYELKIVKLLPNPEGKDSENEKIWILNDEKKKINLKGWAIATGKSMSKLTNHYFKDDFKIDGKEIKEVDRDDCPFSLLNKKGRVVLKSPNGERVDKVKYEKEKIEEGEVYFLEEKEWFWEFSGEVIENSKLGKADESENLSELEEILTDEKYFKILMKLFEDDNSRQSNHSKRICFENWLYNQSQGYFFEFIFPKYLIDRTK